jgi:hypothetical protein
MKKYLRALLLALAVVLGATTLSSCSSPPATMAPAAYGQVVNGVGQCYYIDDPYEAQQLLATGQCPAGWVPTRAPLTWQEAYFAYYDSAAYYNRYVLPAHRTVYVSVETTFRTTYATQITTASKTATYKISSGKTVVGPATAKLKFSSGSGSVGSLGGGSLRGSTSGGSTGGSTGFTGGSIGGGSLRGSTSGGSTGGTGGSKTSSGGLSGGSLRGGRR